MISHIIDFSDLQTFYRFKLVSKDCKQETEKPKYQIPEGEEAIAWILSFRDKDTHVFNVEAFLSDFLRRNRHTKDSYKRLSDAADLYQSHNNLFHFEHQWMGPVNTAGAGLGAVCAALLNDLEILEKGPKAQASTDLNEKRQQLKDMLLLWQPYAIAHDLVMRMFARHAGMWEDIEDIIEIAEMSPALKQFLLNPYLVGLYGSDLGPQQLPKLQQTLLSIRDQLANQEIIKAYQLRDSRRIRSIAAPYRLFELESLKKNQTVECSEIEKIIVESSSRLNSLKDEFDELMKKQDRAKTEEILKLTHSYQETMERNYSYQVQLNARQQELYVLMKETSAHISFLNYFGFKDYRKFISTFHSLPPLASQEAQNFFDSIGFWVTLLKEKLEFNKEKGITLNHIEYFDQTLRHTENDIKIYMKNIEVYMNGGAYPFAAFYMLSEKLDDVKSALPRAYAQAAQKNSHFSGSLPEEPQAF